ncbi:uncharacterized protein A1O9_06445 [Exophiala aquamarina CBS 119918]|uniref:DUF3074 domain-containing protein n=1 Tax=Exophiala aquamarina CBS 119918 TaxID=1182545 RepID=A0A072PEI6_9EURO|nr:uncharacterized protein A1O9_06445 [Exophiala aquamarina CBS 119918]KEF58519.1 hypothetical protein A1O9_06445 [Exophiala aquamarina CBS 119918]
MAALHSHLKYLAPISFSDVPQDKVELDPFLADIFTHVQSIVESIPIPDPDSSLYSNLEHGSRSQANSAAEMSISNARSPPPSPEDAALQKEWGKPIKLSAKENPMNIAVYKLGGKDGKGAWFARRSVHEGLGFSRFKRGFEREFPTSLAVQGAPGEGNIRGIGAETKVEEITVPNRGKVEVYRLSAQFPGPTTPRDFVTLLATSTKAMKPHGDAHKTPDLVPRHYMIISKPCDHPETQPRSGFIRGQYESVEFIREIPRKLKTTTSSTDLSRLGHNRPVSPSLEKEVLMHNAAKHEVSFDKFATDDHRDNKHLSVDTSRSSLRDLSPSSRKRSATVGVPATPLFGGDMADHYDPEDNPVEWIMVTRSDPGGSVPRFMVERGTPSSICADALKFLDWACQHEDDEDTLERHQSRPDGNRRESFASWEANGTLAGIREQVDSLSSAVEDRSAPSTPKASGHGVEPFPSVSADEMEENNASIPSSPSSQSGFIAAVSHTINSYTPQGVRDRLPYLHDSTPKGSPQSVPRQINRDPAVSDLSIPSQGQVKDDDDDTSSTISNTSFASADSHITSDESPSVSSKSPQESQILSQHNKEMTKLAEQKAAMDAKFSQQREKISSQANKDTEKEQQALKKAEEKHEREIKKQEEKYKKELARLEAKKSKEAKKLAEKKRKQEDKDEKGRLTRERDEARAQLTLVQKENDLFQQQIGELQKENTALTARLGKLEGSGLLADNPASGTNRFRAVTLASDGRNRSSSILSRKKNNKADDKSSEKS